MRLGSAEVGAAFAALSQSFDEAVRIEPLSGSDYSEGVADPVRAATDTRAIVSLTPLVEGTDGAMRGQAMRSGARVIVRTGSLWFPPADYVALGYALQDGDRVILSNRPNEKPFLIAGDPVASDRGDVTVNIVIER